MTLPGLLGSLIGCISQGLRRVAAGLEPGHLAFILLALGLPAHDQNATAVAEQIGVQGGFIAGAGPDFVPGPVALLAPGVFVPEAATPGKPITISSVQPSPLMSSAQHVMQSL